MGNLPALDVLHVDDLAVLVVTILSCLLILNLGDLPLNYRARHDINQAHSTHRVRISRLGGMAILAAVLIVSQTGDDFFSARYLRLALTMTPLILVTAWEDMVRPTSPKIRLLAVVASCLLTISYFGVWLMRADLPLLDAWLPGAVGIILTVLFVTTLVNGFNLIDGLNGLCAGIALAALLTMSVIARSVGFGYLEEVTMALSFAVAGFLLFNFPIARIFLGDMGAFILGYLIAWFGISLCYRFPEVSPWAVILILAYPLGDVGITMIRRLIARQNPFQPDRLHLHHLVMELVVRYASGGLPTRWHNPAAALLILPTAVAPMIFAAAYYDNPRLLQKGALVYAVAMMCIYAIAHKISARAQKPVS